MNTPITPTPLSECEMRVLSVEAMKSGLMERIGTDQLIKFFTKAVHFRIGSEFSSFTHHAPNWSIIGVEFYPEDPAHRLEYIPKISDYIDEHPCVPFFTQNRDRVTVAKISDFMSFEEFTRTSLHKYAYGPIGFNYAIAVCASDESNCYYSTIFTHASEDFNELTRKFLASIYPSFLKAYRLNHLVHGRYNQIRQTIDLTIREKETLNWVGMGKTNDEIALLFGKSPRTVEKHIHNLSKKLGFSKRIDLIKYASGEKYIRFRGLDSAA